MGVRLIGLERARLIPNQMVAARERFKRELVGPLVADFVEGEPRGGTWPKGRRRTIQEQTKGFIKGDRVIIGTFNSRFARALDTGRTVRPKPGGVIRFRDREGNFVFTRKPITHTPRPYFGRILTRVPVIVNLVYDRVFSGIGRRA